MPFVITMVPGTWGRKTPWVQRDSLLSKALHDNFQNALTVRVFDWTGSNTHTARKRASGELREHLKALIEEFPGAKQILICHSHAGNVALYALQDNDLRAKVAGVVCMSTPFLLASWRDLGRNANLYLAAAFLLPLLVLSWLTFHDWPEPLAFLMTVGVSALAFSALVQVARLLIHLVNDLVVEMELAPLEQHKLLILRLPGDEASATLVFAQFLCWLTVQFFIRSKIISESIAEIFRDWAQRKGRIVAAAIVGLLAVVGALAAVVFIEIHPEYDFVYIGWRIIFISTVALLTVAVVVFAGAIYLLIHPSLPSLFVQLPVAVLLLPIMILLSLLLILPLGWQVALANIVLDVTTETTPLGLWTVHQLKPREPERASQEEPSLWQRHRIYEHPEAIERICRFIEAA